MRPSIHPMLHLVRHVFPNGSSVVTTLPWQRPYAGYEIVTKFHDIDFLNIRASDLKTRVSVGRKARFENKFQAATMSDESKN